jgi:hypothetical protein
MAKKLKIEFLLLKGEDTKCNSVVTLKNLLSSDGDVSFKRKTIKVGKSESSFKISTNLIQDGNKERYFHILLEKEFDGKNEKKQTDELIVVFKKIKQIIIDSGKTFKIAPLWDDTAFYFSKLSYPHIYEVENLMRKLIYKFMLTKLGSTWFKSALPEDFKTQISKKEREATNAYFEASLYNADFIHVINFLFGKYTVDSNKTFEKIKNAKKISDLKLDDIKQVVPEDNWTRYFEPIIAFDKFKEKWERLYELRCKVAHNTLLTKGDHEEIVKLCNEFKSKITKAIDSVGTIQIEEEDKAELSQSALSSFSNEAIQIPGLKNWLSNIPDTNIFQFDNKLHNLLKDATLPFSQDIYKIKSSLIPIDPTILTSIYNISSSLPSYLFPEKKCSQCGMIYKPNEITLSNAPGLCDDCKKSGGAKLVTQSNP